MKKVTPHQTASLPGLSPILTALAIEVCNATDDSKERLEMIRGRAAKDRGIRNEMLDAQSMLVLHAIQDLDRRYWCLPGKAAAS